jgi:D-alanyl-D-alanine carboxypeptidase (penicillin-binding protein 5/6)
MSETQVRRFAAAVICLATLVPSTALVLAGTATASKGAPPSHSGVVVDGPTPPKVLAKSWLIADADSGEILAAKNAHTRLKPASTLKTLTAVTLLPLLDKQNEYKVQWEDAAVEGSAVGIVPGATYTIDQLFYGMMLPSGNDAAHALANAAGGKVKTVTLMKEEAKRLLAYDTTVRNPSGLDARHQVTSAYDLAIFAREGLQRADFRRYVGTITTAFPAEMPKKDKKRKTYQIYNQNQLLIDGYRGVIGVKTGYTTLAGRTFVAAAERGGQTLIVSLMGIVEPSDVAAERLLNWGFEKVDAVQPVGNLLAAPDSAHQVRPASVPASAEMAVEPEASGFHFSWFTAAFAAILVLVTWLVVRRSRRRPRRASLPPL